MSLRARVLRLERMRTPRACPVCEDGGTRFIVNGEPNPPPCSACGKTPTTYVIRLAHPRESEASQLGLDDAPA